MCGFIGLIRHEATELQQESINVFQRQNEMITHRGPDDEGYYHNEYISFGFRRLSIIDIDSGHQPLSYENERYWIVFNGEIYNYVELRNELIKDGVQFHTESDTEVILAMFHQYGTETFHQLRGMFAILIWDKEKETLYGARDQFGIKPLYYSKQPDGTYFSSEKKAITSILDAETVNREALQHYLSFQYVPEPYSLTEGVEKVEPGHFFTVKPGEDPTFTRFFHATFTPVDGEKSKWISRIQETLRNSVQVHMRSDVPVGSFLSGGIDSSIIVSLAKEFNPGIKTFSVGFDHNGFSEIDVAKETADKLGVENISYVISPEEYVQKLPKIMWHNDDPLADPACVPLYFVAREASKHVTVVLSGEGADELFGGYNIYREPESLKVFDSIPNPAKDLLRKVAHIMPEGVKGKSFLERGTTPLQNRYIGNAKMFEEDEKVDLVHQYNEQHPYQQITRPLFHNVNGQHAVNQMQYVDIHTWLRGDILLKADKMTMAHSLELRVPFLDVEVFKVAREIPVHYKIANGTTKSILREAAKGIVPEHVLNRKKLGFPVPIRHWLKNELYDWAKTLISESQTDYLLNKQVIHRLLEEHVVGKGDYSRKLWTVLMFMLWHQIFVERAHDIEDLRNEDKTMSKLTVM
ncbi:asparagine synthase (glutamine-hydrolyzing) [Salirhabdus salicampi]|uniref:asparagine synthase (glutamine-hydrolyzing) n=1 Tax=Salirhabdus salicampi TaxID=476102 RepID=UPI0020C51AF7|nr:asparagine synthase (glutamine-hydrolyzing) [Salirhabdus salicampi]MCP8617805.1 asparagine synthase (glutamine-hydrolyzing) [Salirhabdus salicampi]